MSIPRRASSSEVASPNPDDAPRISAQPESFSSSFAMRRIYHESAASRVIRCQQLKGKKFAYDVLLVDGERSIAQSTARALLPLRAIVAGSIEEAMTALSAHVPQVVVCDYFLKGKVALPLLKFITEKHPGVRRVVYSGYRDPAIRNALDFGYADMILAKPATPEQLVAAVKPTT
jgi:ActR/RegA family two-component response regulator